MIEWLEAMDRSIVLGANSLHSPWLDKLMWFISGKLTWIPLYIALIVFAYLKFGLKKTLVFVISVVACVAFADLISSQIIKNSIARYRPSHHALLTDRLHFYEIKPGEYYKGGQYGFVSSHAANFFAIAVFVGLVFWKQYKWILISLISIAVIVSFSRLYLGVHYLSDLIGGAAIGTLVSCLIYRFWWKGYNKKTQQDITVKKFH